MSAARFERGAVCSPHVLATEAGRDVLASGGNALDAAIATNLALGVVAPYLCGYGGDLFALIWRNGLHAYNGSGRAPASATPDAVARAAASDRMPPRGALTITVPGAVEAWFALLERFGSRSFDELASAALAFARDGFVPTDRGAASLRAGLTVYDTAHHAAYWHARPSARFAQPDLARTIASLAKAGPDAFYRGEITAAIAGHIQSAGGLLDAVDLAEHHGDWVEPLRSSWRGVDVVELPPNTQGIAVLEALALIGDELPAEPAAREHLMIEAIKVALSDLHAGRAALAAAHITARRDDIDPRRASDPGPGIMPGGGTAYMCAADPDGMCVSLIQSNWEGFGSGLTVPGWGINLHSRGAFFSLDPSSPQVIAPRKRPLHTLIPAMALRGGRPELIFGSMGGTGQAQNHIQLLARIIAEEMDLQEAIDAPRWFCSTKGWTVAVEAGFDDAVVDGLRERGHTIERRPERDSMMGHAHAIRIDEDGFVAACDPRAESAALGI